MKKATLAFIVSAMLITTLLTPVSASNDLNNNTAQETTMETFIEGIENITGTQIENENIIEYSIDPATGVRTIALDDNDGGFVVYSSLTTEETEYLMANPNSMHTRVVWSIIKTIIGVIKKVYTAGKIICQVVEYISGGDPCQQITTALLNSMAQNVRYKSTTYQKKNMNCQPLHSQQCNLYPNVVWETKIVKA